MKKELMLIIGLMGLLLSTQIIAEDVTIEFEGHVTYVYDADNFLNGNIYEGLSFNGFYTYDLSTPDLYPNNLTYGIYDCSSQPYAFMLNIGGMTIYKSERSTFRVSVLNDYGTAELKSDHYQLDINNPTVFLNNIVYDDPGVFSWYMEDSKAIALQNDYLPNSSPIISDWSENYLSYSRGVCGEAFTISGTVTSAVLVPEPLSVAIFCVGSFLFQKRLRRQ